jgi:hypothetical protein
MTVEYQQFEVPPSNRVPRSSQLVNVIATLLPPGADPSATHSFFIVSGHYDSRATNALDSAGDAPGADDDGSGTALVLELARVFSRYEFATAIKFAVYAGEEQGLFGSTHLAETARTEGWQIGGVLNNDIVGSSHGGDGATDSASVRLFSQAYGAADTGAIFRQRNALGLENDGPSRTLARYIRECGEMYVPRFAVRLIDRLDRFLRGGDQTPFHDRGFAAVRFTESKENFDRQHRDIVPGKEAVYGDLPDYMDFNYCANIARVNAAALAALAFAPPPPADAGIIVSQLEYTTTLRWRPGHAAGAAGNVGSGNEPAGYLVLYRETTSPVWQQKMFTKDTTLTIPALKDDYLFGVQAVNAHGDASLPSIPKVAR